MTPCWGNCLWLGTINQENLPIPGDGGGFCKSTLHVSWSEVKVLDGSLLEEGTRPGSLIKWDLPLHDLNKAISCLAPVKQRVAISDHLYWDMKSGMHKALLMGFG